MAVIALMSFVAAATLADLARAQTPAGAFKPAGAVNQVAKPKKTRRAQLQSLPPAPPAAPTPTFDERPGPKMGM
jgi:hypothetical protein